MKETKQATTATRRDSMDRKVEILSATPTRPASSRPESIARIEITEDILAGNPDALYELTQSIASVINHEPGAARITIRLQVGDAETQIAFWNRKRSWEYRRDLQAWIPWTLMAMGSFDEGDDYGPFSRAGDAKMDAAELRRLRRNRTGDWY